MSIPLLEAQNLAVFRGEHCLFSGVSFCLQQRSVLQLHGDNGSGKTTLLRALCTLLPIEEGTILWRGETIPAAREQYFAEMIYSGHSEAIKGDLTARENLLSSAAIRGVESTGVDDVIQRIGLSHRADLPCRSLSAGQRRRVTLARLLVSKAVLWILDEPLTSLDVQGRALVEELIAGHAAGGGSVVFTTHQPLSLQGCDVQMLELGH